MWEVKTENNISCRQSPSSVDNLHFSCQHAHSFAVDMIFSRVEAIQSINMAPIAVDRLGVLVVSNSVQEFAFESDLNSDWLYFFFM